MILACDLFDFIPQYNLTLVASDALHEFSSLVCIRINDINDLPPKFEQPSYITTILEEDAEGMPKSIMKVYGTFKKVDYAYMQLLTNLLLTSIFPKRNLD